MKRCLMLVGSLALVWGVFAAKPVAAGDAADIRARLMQWTADFNAGRKDAACDLFSKDLISDFRGQGEADYAKRCELISNAIDNKARTFRYELNIKEILPGRDLVVVRLEWTLHISPGDVTSVEPGMDIFRKEPDGAWRIIRYMAYEK